MWEIGQPVNVVEVENHSPLELDKVSLSAEIFGEGAGVPPEKQPYQRYLKFPETLSPRRDELWPIDEVVEESAGLVPSNEVGIGQLQRSKVFVKLTLKYRRKTDGTEFQASSLFAIVTVVDGRPIAVYPRATG